MNEIPDVTPTDDDSYWSIDVPGLSEEQAEALTRDAAQFGLTGTLVDPHFSYTRHLDVSTVDSLVRRLRGVPPVDDDDVAIESLVEDLETWRQHAR